MTEAGGTRGPAGKRLLDVAVAVLGLALAAPLLALAALAARLSSPGPLLYRARRVGRGGRPFTMYKLRTMHPAPPGSGSPITGPADPRVFPAGRLLRLTKVDELPQLVNVLRGEMSLVGPRPEDPDVVARHYAPLHRETLSVRPGLTSPGTLYHDIHGDRVLTGGDPETRYAEALLPLKLALDLVYVRRASLSYDLAMLWRTVVTVGGRLLGRRTFPEPPELSEALALVVPARSARRTGPMPGRPARPAAGQPRPAAAGGSP
ncbi:MAG TPA: sugar transferase [Gemmatimonadales bacterium]|nr:sugar transferase [Gemmatimonadales bacterium]